MNVDRVGKVELSLHWRIRKQIMYLWEIDSDALAPLVPAPLEPIEVRPGIGLLALEALHYHTDHFRPGYPEFLEVVLTAAVQPDLSVDMPVPRFCMHAISVISESPEFCEQEGRILFTPTELVPGLRMEFSEDGASCDIYDGDEPIALCRNSPDGAPVYEPKVLWGQYYTNTRGLQHGIWRWDGEMFEHQKKGEWGRFTNHPFFKGIDISRVRGCYRRMMARPDFQNSARFYHIGPR